MEQIYTDQYINAMVQPLFESMSKRVSKEEMEIIHKAYDVALTAHRGQYRKSGDPYIFHPIAVARIVAEELGLGANPVCAAFLHDVVEDTPWTIDDIEAAFGKDIAFLVKVVTKTPKAHYDETKQVDNFRQLVTSINYDIRALLIKLADRLHNMRTLKSMTDEKQMKIAGETDFFYAPIANRLGLYDVKIELENLSFRYRCPREYAHIENLIGLDMKRYAPVLDSFMDTVRGRLAENGISASVETVWRRPFSIRRKMLSNGEDFNHIDNRCYVRIVYDDCGSLSEKEMALLIYAKLSDVLKEKPGSVVNHIDTPKENGYQSLHVKFLAANGMWVEVHISSARMRRISRLGCIAERDEKGIAGWIAKFKDILKDISFHASDIQLMEGVTLSFYNDNIIAYTPKGKGITLPKNATALDFAFDIHSEIGLHAHYARINGKLCSVKTEIKHGDCVEIGTSDTVSPDRSWLSSVSTYRAKRVLRTWFNSRPDSSPEHCCHCHPLPGDEVVGFKMDDGTVEVHRRDCPHAISMASQHGDSVVAVDFQPDEKVLYPVGIHVRGVDRKRLLVEIVDCISGTIELSIDKLHTETNDAIVDCDIVFSVHSYYELEKVITAVSGIENVDEVWQQDISLA